MGMARTNRLLEELSAEVLTFIGNARDAGNVTQQEHDLFVEQAIEDLMVDPYWPEPVNVWERAGVAPVYLVVAFHKSRRYAGAEEGGWWYDHMDTLTDMYAESHGRSFIITGPFRDDSEAWDVARDLSAFEHGRSWSERNIVWRACNSVPRAIGQRPVYC